MRHAAWTAVVVTLIAVAFVLAPESPAPPALPAAEAQRQIGLKSAREYTDLQRDLQEADLKHLEQAALVYDRLATEPNWVTVECFDAASSIMRPPEAIHRAVLAAVEARLTGLAAAK